MEIDHAPSTQAAGILRGRFGRLVAGILAALLALGVTSCTSSRDTPPDRPPTTGASGLQQTGSTASTASCPVSTPRPVPRRYRWSAGLFGSDMALGNGKLWVGGLGRNGVIAISRGNLDPHGRASWKLGWWRVVPGELHITGRRLDGPGRLTSDAGTVAEYGPQGFVASGVTFSEPGCWEITGRIGTATLTFRTRVVIPH